MQKRSLIMGFIVLCSLIPAAIGLADSNIGSSEGPAPITVPLFDTGITATATVDEAGDLVALELESTEGFAVKRRRAMKYDLVSVDGTTTLRVRGYGSLLSARMVRSWPGGQKETQRLTIRFTADSGFVSIRPRPPGGPVVAPVGEPSTPPTTTPAEEPAPSNPLAEDLPPAPTTTTTLPPPPAPTTTTTLPPPPAPTTTTTLPPPPSGQFDNVVFLSGDYPDGLDTRDGARANTLINAVGGTFKWLRIYNIGSSTLRGGTYDYPSPTKDNTGIALRYSPNVIVERVKIVSAGDGVSFGAGVSGFTLRDSFVEITADDLIENDYAYQGLVEDNLMIGHGPNAFSCRVGSSRRGLPRDWDHTWTFNSNLVRITNGKIWKLEHRDPPGCNFNLHNNIFFYDGDVGDFSEFWLNPEDDEGSQDLLLSASNNIVVWPAANGPFPGPVPPGFTITNDVSVWANAQAAWLASHQIG